MTTISDLQTIQYSGDLRVDSLLDSSLNWNYLLPQRNTLYYTFDISSGTADSSPTLSSFNSAQRSAVVAILSYVSTLTGIQFQEMNSGAAADIHFSACDIDGGQISGLCQTSWSWSYWSDGEISQYSADAYVYLDNVEFAADNTVPAAGGNGYQVLLHEIGHALGLSHPFDGPYFLPNAVDDTNHTVMSYDWTGADKTTYQAYDLLALQWLYGGDGLRGQYGINSAQGPTLGTPGNDVLTGDVLGIVHNDTLSGIGGNDSLSGLSGNDRLDGGNGNDTLDGGTGNDTLIGGSGSDTYIVDAVGDVVTETVSLATEIDLVKSSITYALNTAGREQLENLTLLGTGNLNGTGNAKANVLAGNTGNNSLSGLDGADTLYGNSGNDRIDGGNGNDTLDGGTGNDTLIGGSGSDTYIVDAVGDVVTETVSLATEIDLVKSSITYALNTAGREQLENLTLLGTGNLNGTGNARANVLTGNTGNNNLSGLDGADTLYGNSGNDRIDGGNGNDILTGGSGQDTLIGGGGSDRFVFDSLAQSLPGVTHDVVSDFRIYDGDRIDLLAIDANTGLTGNQAFTYIGNSAFSKAAGQLKYAYNAVSHSGLLTGDVNGDAIADFELQLIGVASLDASNLIL